MAFGSVSRSLLRNLDNVRSYAQTLSSGSGYCVGSSHFLHNARLSCAPSSSRDLRNVISSRQQTRSISLTLSPALSAEKAPSVSTEEDADFSVIDEDPFSSPDSAASLIRAQMEDAVNSLPLTERLFAVVLIDGKQYRVSQDDVLTVEDWLIAEAGERIRLEKVLLVGGREFSFIGRPLLRRSQVSVEATIIEKSLTATDIIRRFRQRSRFKRTWLTRKPITYLRINSIKLLSPE